MKKKAFGKLTAVLSSAVMAGSMLSALPATVSAEGLSGLDAKGITSQMVIGWNLGNTLDCSGTNYSSTASPEKFVKAWGQPVPTAELVQTVKDAGFNTIRIPTTWYEKIEWDESSQMYVVNEQWMNFVKQVVDYAYDRDMFVILNVHHENFINVKQFTDDTYAEASEKLEDIWTQVAETFADYDQHLIFEGMNEPRQTGNSAVSEWGNGSGDNGYSWNYVNNLNKVFADTVRSQGSNANKERLLMMPAYVATSDTTALQNLKIPDNAGNVAISVHAYAPYFFTMDTSSYANHEFPGASGWGEDYGYALTNLFNGLDQIQKEKNAPIIIGEFSASDFNNTESRVNWAKDYLSKAKAVGIPCVLWDNNALNNGGESHGYLYRATNTWYPNAKPVIQAMMDVYGVQSSMKDYEVFVKPAFDWKNIPVGDNWIELYKNETGKKLDAWDNFTVKGWKDYMNENYDFVLVYDSDNAPELVLQDSDWNRVASSDETETPYIKTFTYDDFVSALDEPDSATSLFVSATMSELTAYGLYAVPKGDVTPEPTTEETTEPSEEPTDEPFVPLYQAGDVDCNGKTELADIIRMQKYLLGVEKNLIKVPEDEFAKPNEREIKIISDLNGDGKVNVIDLALLKRLVLFGTFRLDSINK